MAATRRTFLKRGGQLAGAVAMVSLAEACAAPVAPPPGQAAPAPSAAAAKPVRGGAITIAVRREAGELDPHKPTIGTTRVYARALYNTLTNVDLKGTVVPELALSWNAPDPKTWLFKLRTGVKFHDGTDFDAAAVKFNFERVIDAATASLWRAELFPNVASVDVVDSSTVKVSLKEADVSLPARLSGRAGHMVSPAAVRKWGKDFALHPVGSGPFEFVEWVKDDHLTVKRFEGYWDKDESGTQLPYLDRVTYKPIADAGVMLTNLRTGQLDLIEAINPSDLSKVTGDANLKAVEGPGATQLMWFNMDKPPFNNKGLRQAVAWAVDREAIHKGIYFSTGAVANFTTRAGHWAHDDQGKFYTRDLAKAKAALATAGQPNGFKFSAIIFNLPLELQYAQAMKSQLAEVGIDMTVVPLESTVQAARRRSGDFEAGYSNNPPNPDPDTDFLAFQTGTAVNYARYSNPKADQLIIGARGAVNVADRGRMYKEVQALALDDAPGIFLHIDADIKAMSVALQGYVAQADTYVGGLARMWLKK